MTNGVDATALAVEAPLAANAKRARKQLQATFKEEGVVTGDHACQVLANNKDVGKPTPPFGFSLG